MTSIELKSADYELVILLLAMSLSLRFRFCTSRKGRTGGGGWVVQTAWVLLSLAVEKPWLALAELFLPSLE